MRAQYLPKGGAEFTFPGTKEVIQALNAAIRWSVFGTAAVMSVYDLEKGTPGYKKVSARKEGRCMTKWVNGVIRSGEGFIVVCAEGGQIKKARFVKSSLLRLRGFSGSDVNLIDEHIRANKKNWSSPSIRSSRIRGIARYGADLLVYREQSGRLKMERISGGLGAVPEVSLSDDQLKSVMKFVKASEPIWKRQDPGAVDRINIRLKQIMSERKRLKAAS